MPETWSWTVRERVAIRDRCVVVVGDRAGILPTVGEQCVVKSDGKIVDAVIGAFARLHHAPGHVHRDDVAGHELGLQLEDVDPEDVPVGAIVTSTRASDG